MSNSNHPRHDGLLAWVLTLLGGGTHTQLNGNIHSVHPTEFDSSTLPVSGHRNGPATPLVVQVAPQDSPLLRKLLNLKVDWTQGGPFRQQVSANSTEGGFEPSVGSEEPQAQQLSSTVDIHPTSVSGDDIIIGETLGCLSSSTVHDQAHSIQKFRLDENTAAYLIEKPSNEIMPAGAAGPSKIKIGRAVGCVQTGDVLPGGISEQTYGFSPSTSSSEHQGYSVIATKRPSNSGFVAMGAGKTLGIAPSSPGYTPHVRRP